MLVIEGRVTGLTGLVAGNTYFLSGVTAGVIAGVIAGALADTDVAAVRVVTMFAPPRVQNRLRVGAVAAVVMTDVQAQTRTIPTPTELVAELPAMIWGA